MLSEKTGKKLNCDQSDARCDANQIRQQKRNESTYTKFNSKLANI